MAGDKVGSDSDGIKCLVDAGTSSSALLVLGLDTTRCSHTERFVAEKRKEDPMLIGAIVKFEGPGGL